MPPLPSRLPRAAPRRRLPFRTTALVALALLAACGQKGPLVLPDRDAADVVIRAPAAPATPAATTPATTPAAPPATTPATTPPGTPPAAPTPAPAPKPTSTPPSKPAAEPRP